MESQAVALFVILGVVGLFILVAVTWICTACGADKDESGTQRKNNRSSLAGHHHDPGMTSWSTGTDHGWIHSSNSNVGGSSGGGGDCGEGGGGDWGGGGGDCGGGGGGDCGGGGGGGGDCGGIS